MRLDKRNNLFIEYFTLTCQNFELKWIIKQNTGVRWKPSGNLNLDYLENHLSLIKNVN